MPESSLCEVLGVLAAAHPQGLQRLFELNGWCQGQTEGVYGLCHTPRCANRLCACRVGMADKGKPAITFPLGLALPQWYYQCGSIRM